MVVMGVGKNWENGWDARDGGAGRRVRRAGRRGEWLDPGAGTIGKLSAGTGSTGSGVLQRFPVTQWSLVTRSNDQAVQVSNLPLIRSGLSKMGLDCYQSAVNWSLRPGTA